MVHNISLPHSSRWIKPLGAHVTSLAAIAATAVFMLPMVCVNSAWGLDQGTQPTATWTVQPDWQEIHGTELFERTAQRAMSTPRQQGDAPIVIEAENVKQPYPQLGGNGQPTGALFTGEKDSAASNQRYVDRLHNGHWPFEVVTAGTYQVWFRMYVPINAFWDFKARVDEDEQNHITIPPDENEAQTWFWKAGPVAELKPGTHSLQVINLLNGKRIDRIVIQSSTLPAPENIGPEASPTTATAQGELIAPLMAAPKNVRWRASNTALAAGMQFRVDAESPWQTVDDQWHVGPACYRLLLGDTPVRLDQVTVELDWPSDALRRFTCGAGQLMLDAPTGRLVGLIGGQVNVAQLTDEPLFGIRWWDDELTLHTSSANDWRFDADASQASQNGPLHYTHQPTGVRLVVTAEPVDGELLLHAEIENASSYRVAQVIFPQLPPLVVGDAQTSQLVWPGKFASLFAKPETQTGQTIPYPRASMNYMAYADDTGGFYVATYDAAARFNQMTFAPTRTGAALIMDMTRVDSIAPGEVGETRTISLALTRGDWRSAAALYRRWFYQTHGQAQLPDWITQGVGWIALGMHEYWPIAFYGQQEMEIDDPWWFGSDRVQVWGHGPILTCCPNYYYPDPGRGGEDGFKRFVTTLREHGLTVGSYFHGHSINPIFTKADRFRGMDVSDLPTELQPPSYDWFVEHRHMPTHDSPAYEVKPESIEIMEQQGGGAETNGRVPRIFTELCWDQAYRDYLNFWVTRYMDEYDVHVPYLDVWGIRPSTPEYNPNIGFGDGRQAERMKLFLDGMIEHGEQSVGPDFGFAFEGYADIWSLRGISLLSGLRRQPEVIRATLPDHVLVEGNNNGQWSPPYDVASLGRAFADGNYLDMMILRPSRSEVPWMKDAVRMWQAQSTYAYTDGVIEAPDTWMVRKFVGNGFAMWHWFDADRAGGKLRLDTKAEKQTEILANNHPTTPVRWFTLTATGDVRPIDGPESNSTAIDVTLPPAYVGTVLAVWDSSASASSSAPSSAPSSASSGAWPQPYMAVVTTALDVESVVQDGQTVSINHAHQTIHAVNVTNHPITIPVTVRDFDRDQELASTVLSIAPGQSLAHTIPVTTAGQSIRTLIQVGDEPTPRRRLSPTPFENGQLLEQRYQPGMSAHPDEPSRFAFRDYVRRRIYWPDGVKGVITLRYKQTHGARISVRIQKPQDHAVIAGGRGEHQQDQWLTMTIPFTGVGHWVDLRVGHLGKRTDPNATVWIDQVSITP